MANEKRLIDANGLWSDIMMLPHNGDMISSQEVEQAIKDAPTVDAVEVVRCKDCSYWWDRGFGKGTCDRETEEMGLSRLYLEDDFCSYGERRTDG